MFGKSFEHYKNNYIVVKWLISLKLPNLTQFKKCES